MSINGNRNIGSLMIVLLAISIIASFPALIMAEGSAVIWTDKSDYSPGEIVTIYGENFTPKSDVVITILRPDNTIDTLCVTSDEEGGFIAEYHLNGIEGEYKVTATDGINTAETTFTDAVNIASVEPSGSTYPPRKENFLKTEDVYAIVKSSSGSGENDFRIYVVSLTPKPGRLLNDVSGGYETFEILDQGTYGPFLIWQAPTTVGKYYIVVDDNKNGRYDEGDAYCSFTISVPPGQEQLISVSKGGPECAHEDDTINYTITITNPSTGTIMYKVSVIDSLLGDISANFSNSLAPGASETRIFTYKIPTPQIQDVVNTVTVTYKDAQNKEVTDTASWSVDVLHPSIDVEKTGPQYAYEGDEITYTITVENTGDCQLYNVNVTDTLLGTLLTNGYLDVGESKEFTQTYTVSNDDLDPLVNTVTAEGKDALGKIVSVMASHTVDVLHPAIDVIKSANASMIHEGDWVKYNVTVVNIGDCDLTVTLEDRLLGISWSGTLKPDEKHEEIVSIQPADDPTVNEANATGVDPLSMEVSDSGSCTVDILHPKIMVTKVANVTVAHIGDTIEYMINVTNIGDCTLYGVNVTDSLFGDLFTNGVLDASDSVIFTRIYTVERYGLLTNTVTALGEDALGLKVSESDSWTVTVLPKSMVTTSGLCYFDFDSATEGQQFRLIFTQDPTSPSTYKLTASNPGQFYYNVFYIGTPGEEVNLKIKIPYSFVTQGAAPIHVYSAVDIVGGCFIPSGDITSSFTINPKSIALEDYTNGYVEVSVSGKVPSSELVYVTIHLDYGLKKTVGYMPDFDKNALKDSSASICNYGDYMFSCEADGALLDVQIIENVNVFKRDPGFAGIVIDGKGNPVAGVEVKIYGPDGKLLATVKTDGDGWYFFNYKHTGKTATYTIICNGTTKKVTVKANQLVQVDFML